MYTPSRTGPVMGPSIKFFVNTSVRCINKCSLIVQSVTKTIINIMFIKISTKNVI